MDFFGALAQWFTNNEGGLSVLLSALAAVLSLLAIAAQVAALFGAYAALVLALPILRREELEEWAEKTRPCCGNWKQSGCAGA